jgi:hypothetical protein
LSGKQKNKNKTFNCHALKLGKLISFGLRGLGLKKKKNAVNSGYLVL